MKPKSSDRQDHPALRGPSSFQPSADTDVAAEPVANVDVVGIEGALKRKSVHKMSALVDEHPAEALSALRRWLHDGNGTE